MSQFPLPSAARASSLFAAALLVVVDLSPALALEPLRERQRIETQSRTRGIDIEILRQRSRRENFQRRQDVLRETDRAKGRDLRIDAPLSKMQRNCQVQPFGATFLRNCR